MIRQIAGRLTGTAVSTVRFATAIPLAVARGVLEHVKDHVSEGDDATASETPQRQQPPQRDPQEQAAQASKAPSGGATRKTATPAKTRKKAGTPAAGDVRQDEDGPDVVLAVDAPPAEVEPPVDVVGEALAAEEAQKAQEPPRPQPVHVNEETEVVYSTTSDDD